MVFIFIFFLVYWYDVKGVKWIMFIVIDFVSIYSNFGLFFCFMYRSEKLVEIWGFIVIVYSIGELYGYCYYFLVFEVVDLSMFGCFWVSGVLVVMKMILMF